MLSAPDTFAAVGKAVEAIPTDRWVNIVVGIQIPIELCRDLGGDVVSACEIPLQRALALHEVVAKST